MKEGRILMYSFEQHITVRLQFNAMEQPVEISVPWKVLGYLDTHAERCVAADGSVIYRNPHMERLRAFPAFANACKQLMAAAA